MSTGSRPKRAELSHPSAATEVLRTSFANKAPAAMQGLWLDFGRTSLPHRRASGQLLDEFATSRRRIFILTPRGHKQRWLCHCSRHEATNVRFVGHLKTGAIPHPHQRAVV